LAKQLNRELGAEWNVVQFGDHITILSKEYLAWDWIIEGDIQIFPHRYPWEDLHFVPMQIDLEVQEFISEEEFRVLRPNLLDRMNTLRKEMDELNVPKFKGRHQKPDDPEALAVYERFQQVWERWLDRPTHHNGRVTVKVHRWPRGGGWMMPIDMEKHLKGKDGDPPHFFYMEKENFPPQPVRKAQIGYSHPYWFEHNFWQVFESVLTPYPAE